MVTKLFISKQEQDIQKYLPLFKAKSFEVISHSFLQFEAFSFQIQKPYQALFFGSPRAVDFFLKQEIISNNIFIGCIGEVTAKSLTDNKIKVNFIGESSSDPTDVAKQFQAKVGKKNILFPQSLGSHRSIVRVFPSLQTEELAIYKTVIIPQSIPSCDTYVFTSPSNADGFLKENTISENAKIIAWGKTTEKHILAKGLRTSMTLKEASMEELISVLG